MTSRTTHRTADFDYPLPESLIAQVPSPSRGDSRLLVVRRHGSPGEPGTLADFTFDRLVELLAPADLLVLNDTRVRHARLPGRRPSGAPAEVLLIHPGPDDTWVAIGKPGSAMRPGKAISLGDGMAVRTMEVLPGGERIVRFEGGTAAQAMATCGLLPLPPYIQRPPGPQDEVRYQTVFARRAGSVAAPTAGLHLTTDLLAAIERNGVRVATIDLEVGPGTFRPVEEDRIDRHRMHPERYHIPRVTAELIATTRLGGGRVWAVGTTVVRALESAARDGGQVAWGDAETRLMITPGYRFRVVDRLVTNFHLPRSTLLMLVSAFAGYRTTMAAYRHAVAQHYRFYSYGDAMVAL